MTQHITVRRIEHNGVTVAERGEMMSLTDMWKAAGSPSGRAPTDWLALVSTKEFVACVEATLNAGNPGIKAKKGKGGGTFGHWQIGLAYAKYLDPVFHMKCNTVVRERMEGRNTPAHVAVADLDENVRAMIGNMIKNCTGVVVRDALSDAVSTLLPAMVQAEIAKGSILRRHGNTCGQIWHRHGLPKIKNAPTWLGNRLAEMGCLVNDGDRAEFGGRSVRLFDPDKADRCMKNGLSFSAQAYVAKRRGQGSLRLVQPVG